MTYEQAVRKADCDTYFNIINAKKRGEITESEMEICDQARMVLAGQLLPELRESPVIRYLSREAEEV